MKSRCERPSLPSQAPPRTLVPGSLPSSLCPTRWCQCHQQIQWVTSSPGGGTRQAGEGRRRAHLLGGSLGLGQAAAEGQWAPQSHV